MNTRRFSATICNHISSGNVKLAQTYAVHPVSGELVRYAVQPDQPQALSVRKEDLTAPLVEAWLNSVWLPRNTTGGTQGHRDHAGGGGYSENVRKTARVWITTDSVYVYLGY